MPCSVLWKALFVAYGGPYVVAAGLKIIQDFLAFLQPQLLRLLLAFIARYQSTKSVGDRRPSSLEGFSIAALMFFAATAQTICLNQVRSCFLLTHAQYSYFTTYSTFNELMKPGMYACSSNVSVFINVLQGCVFVLVLHQ
jgi:hypothetical protein